MTARVKAEAAISGERLKRKRTRHTALFTGLSRPSEGVRVCVVPEVSGDHVALAAPVQSGVFTCRVC